MALGRTCSFGCVLYVLVSGVSCSHKPAPHAATERLAEALSRRDAVSALSAIDKGARVMEITNLSRPSLELAVETGSLDLVKRLLQSGADINVKGEHGEDLLQTAAAAGYPDICAFLIAEGLNPNATNVLGNALTISILSGHYAASKVLLSAGAKPDVPTVLGKTPLHGACFLGRMDLVELLITNGANVSITDRFGHTPLFTAERRGFSNVVEYLSQQTKGSFDPERLQKKP